MNRNDKIYIAGHEGMVGSILLQELINRGFKNIIKEKFGNLDLRKQKETFDYINCNKPDYIFLIAGKVGGINANIQYPATFLYDNLMIASNVIDSAYKNNVKKMIFLGSSCIYPRLCKQPMKEDYLLTGSLEPTNEGYAIGKITGLKLCEYYNKQYNCNFISAMPPNLYGPRDSFSLEHSHVISALIQKIHKAKLEKKLSVEMWGTGKARREFLYNQDLVDGLIFLMDNYNDAKHINIGSGKDVSIIELAILIKKIIGYHGEFVWNRTKPDGMPRKLMDVSTIQRLGWKSKTKLIEGLTKTYNWFLNNVEL